MTQSTIPVRFKEGDIVTCVENSENMSLTVGKDYRVTRTPQYPGEQYITVVNDNGVEIYYFATRFRPNTEETVVSHKQENLTHNEAPIPDDVMRVAASVEYDRETSITNAVARAIMADREARDASIMNVALEEAAVILESRKTVFMRDAAAVIRSLKGGA